MRMFYEFTYISTAQTFITCCITLLQAQIGNRNLTLPNPLFNLVRKELHESQNQKSVHRQAT